jgi:acyl-CoA synthetase (AMP-forming)/AMP-acid ligase II
VRAFCAKVLASYKLPDHLEVLEEPLPRNASGKVLKTVLQGEAVQTFIEE